MKLLFKAFHWLLHYSYSNTLHGTHSPFVYAFLEKAVYQQSHGHPKNIGLITRISNFMPKGAMVFVYADESNGQNLVELGIKIHHVQNAEELLALYHQHKNTQDAESAMVFTNIYKDKNSLVAWKKICADARNNVSIDLFHTGILFFDQKKPKEHFRIYY
jgi:hypothetical protein